LPDTNVLLTRFLSDDGLAKVSDFMPVEDAGVAHNIVRRAKTVRGEVRLHGVRSASANAAYTHLQLDIQGELMDSLYLYDKYGSPVGHDAWTSIVRLVDWVCEHWREKDESIWQVRGGRQEFLYSRLMRWVAIDRAIRLANKRSFPAPLSRWYDARDSIHRDIFERFWR
jgi:GH15 family glucan-1,4-alpha-glucosidase